MEFIPEDIYKLLVSFLLGAVIGTEREYRSKSAGLRTMILIAVGSTLFTILSIKISSDAGRIAANILITKDGNIDLMAHIPIEADEIEDLMNR